MRCLEIQLITSLNLSLDAKLINIRFSLLIRLPLCFCLCKNYIKRWPQCVDVNIGGRKYALRCVIGNVGDGNFRPSFYKKQYLSNGQASCREISHKHCKQMAFHDTKKNNR